MLYFIIFENLEYISDVIFVYDHLNFYSIYQNNFILSLDRQKSNLNL